MTMHVNRVKYIFTLAAVMLLLIFAAAKAERKKAHWAFPTEYLHLRGPARVDRRGQEIHDDEN